MHTVSLNIHNNPERQCYGLHFIMRETESERNKDGGVSKDSLLGGSWPHLGMSKLKTATLSYLLNLMALTLENNYEASL